MKKHEIIVGGHYTARVSENLVIVRVDNIRNKFMGGPQGGERTSYDVTNLKTGRKTTFRSAAKFRAPAKGPTPASTRFKSGEESDPLATEACSDPINHVDSDTTNVSSVAESLNDQTEKPLTRKGMTDSVQTTAEKCVSAESIHTVKHHLSEGEQRQNPPSCESSSETSSGEGKDCPDPTTLAEPVPTVAGLTTTTTVPASSSTNGLKGDQIKTFSRITQLLREKQQVIKLCGYAGSGKTWLLAEIARWAQREGFEVTICAPTHKAAGVIEGKLGPDNTIEVRTIHSLLGLKLEPDFENDTGGRVLKASDKRSEARGLVICDEASMVGETLKEHIDRSYGVSWLFVGDLAQLPPVGESVSKLLNDPDVTLSKVLRQAEGSEILNLATRIRQGDMSMDFADGKDVHQVGTAEDLFQASLGRFDSPEYREDASHARMLVFRNERRKSINQRMRSLLVNSEDPYAPGEWLVMYAAFSPEKSKLNVLAGRARKFMKGEYGYGRAWKQFFNYKESLGGTVTQLHVSEEVRVREASEGMLSMGEWSFHVWRLLVTAREEKVFELPVLMADEQERITQILAELAQKSFVYKQERDNVPHESREWLQTDDKRKKTWQTYYSLEETFAQVDYAYAMTVHKSQGSTFDHVFVDVPDLMGSGGMQGKILYTAVTRPSKTLTFYR